LGKNKKSKNQAKLIRIVDSNQILIGINIDSADHCLEFMSFHIEAEKIHPILSVGQQYRVENIGHLPIFRYPVQIATLYCQ
jgi:hypothetical protein